MISKKLKSLPPTQRDKRRYLVFRILSKNNFTLKQTTETINKALKDFIGILGVAGAGTRIITKRWSQKTQTGIIMVNNKYLNELKASLTLITKINNKTTTIQSRGVSGILKKTKRFLEE